MARRDTRPDPKEAALAGARCLNPHPEQVTDPDVLASDFFDARDAVQAKYEMVPKVRAGGAPVTEAAAAFGYSRPAYYAAAAALESSGLEGLGPAQLAGEAFLNGGDGQRADAAGQQIMPVPGLASTTAAGLARRVTPAQWRAGGGGRAAGARGGLGLLSVA